MESFNSHVTIFLYEQLKIRAGFRIQNSPQELKLRTGKDGFIANARPSLGLVQDQLNWGPASAKCKSKVSAGLRITPPLHSH